MVVAEGMRPALFGVALGLAGAFAFKRAVSSLVFGVRVHRAHIAHWLIGVLLVDSSGHGGRSTGRGRSVATQTPRRPFEARIRQFAEDFLLFSDFALKRNRQSRKMLNAGEPFGMQTRMHNSLLGLAALTLVRDCIRFGSSPSR
jgi:hypothetical protein